MIVGKIKRKLKNKWKTMQTDRKLRRIRKKYCLKIMNVYETLAYIKTHKCSIARYGDGELMLMLQAGGPGFQKGSAELAAGLKRALQAASPELLVCMPGAIVTTEEYRDGGRRFWKKWALGFQQQTVSMIRDLTPADYVFGDTFLSRPYSPYRSGEIARKQFPLLKELWDGQDVLFVEGACTRLGVGNDLFNNARSIKRILGPAEDAFSVYDRILETTLSCWKGELVILALGPSATVLAADLSQKGIRALDLGHIDIQYEWFLSGESFVPVRGKYTHEASEGRRVDTSDDETYLSQIIARVDR